MQRIALVTILVFNLISLSSQSTITVEQIWKDYSYAAKSVPGFNFMNDGRHYTRLVDNKIVKYDLTTGAATENILSGDELNGISGFDGKLGAYTFSPDESFIMIESEKESIYRRSSKAYFYLYERATKTLTSIYPDDKIMYATLSPDAQKVAYVYENNIYLNDLKTGQTKALTTDGTYNRIINGSADWVYEEEFSFAKAFFWSPDSKYIAYQKFDESEVSEFTMTNYNNDLYPEYVTFKYPKVGEKNAIVSVHLYDLSNDESIKLNTGEEVDIYIPRIKWTNEANQLFIYKMNRHQNHLEVFNYHTDRKGMVKVIDEKSPYYIDITDDIRFLKDNKSFIWSSEKSGFNHLYLYDINGKEIRALTQGNYDVTAFYGVDEKNGSVYYQAAEKNPMEKHVFKVNLEGNNKSCLNDTPGTHTPQFSSTFAYYVNGHSTINTPAYYAVYDNNNKEVRLLEDNKNLKTKMETLNPSPVEFWRFTTSEEVELNGWMIKPPNFDTNKKYPVFMYLYGGPGSQQVTDSWKGQNYWWFQMLAQNGYIVACVDNRGTGARGEKFKKMTYMQLGHYETIDQIEAAKYLGSLDYVDATRIGIFGWSYGGYMSSLCLLKGNDIFKAAIAVAPVTNWKWYDTIYTERYMRTASENPEGYANNSPVNFADRLKGNYLLIHGMGDDNVHFQNTAEMANALIKANKQFDTYFYPNRNHGIYGGNTRLHLYNKMTDFILNKL